MCSQGKCLTLSRVKSLTCWSSLKANVLPWAGWNPWPAHVLSRQMSYPGQGEIPDLLMCSQCKHVLPLGRVKSLTCWCALNANMSYLWAGWNPWPADVLSMQTCLTSGQGEIPDLLMCSQGKCLTTGPHKAGWNPWPAHVLSRQMSYHWTTQSRVKSLTCWCALKANMSYLWAGWNPWPADVLPRQMSYPGQGEIPDLLMCSQGRCPTTVPLKWSTKSKCMHVKVLSKNEHMLIFKFYFQHNSSTVSPALRMWDMADNTDDATKDPDILQHLSEAHLQNPMAREDLKWRSVGASGTGTSGQADTAEEAGLDRTHPQEASIQHHMPSSDLEPAREEEERPASQQFEARHWSRAETAGDQLVRNDKSSPEQSAMAGGRWWPMLH